MKLHKTCVCGVSTHVKSKSIVNNECPACHTVYPEIAKVKRVPTENELNMVERQSGYKECSACKKFTAGPRSENCVHCNHSFSTKVEKPTPVEVHDRDDETVEYISVPTYPEEYKYPEHMKNRRCYVPAGPCPYRLRSNDENKLPAESAIRAWAFKVRQEILKTTGDYLTNEALLYWARQEVNSDLRFGRNSEEMNYLKEVIKTVPDISYKKIAI